MQQLNKIRNADFSRGRSRPASWDLTEPPPSPWVYHRGDANGEVAGIALCATKPTTSGWSQRFRCRKDQYYRIEALVSCACAVQPGRGRRNGSVGSGGLVVAVEMYDQGQRPIERYELPPLVTADRLIHRAYFKTPTAARSVRVSVGLANATGSVAIHEVRVFAVIEPELKSYALAIPPPPYADKPPVRVRRVLVVSADTDRLIVERLAACFGGRAVRVCAPGDFDPQAVRSDAVIWADDAVSDRFRKIEQAEAVARDRVVILSTGWLAVAAGDAARVRTIRQTDDPIHARVVHADYATHGFALHDILPFAGRSGLSADMYQRQFRGGPAFRALCARHGLEVMLHAVTDSDSTSEKPIALFRRTSGGSLMVMDMDAAEVADTSTDDATAAMHLILSALGRQQTLAGQFVDPARTEEELGEHLCDLVERFAGLYWYGGRAPRHLRSPCCIRVGRDLESAGLSLRPRPVILIRSGMTGHDIEGVYAVMLWLKQLLRPAPFVHPFARLLGGRFRVIWVPLLRRIEPWGGWRSDATGSPWRIEPDFDPDTVAGCLDVTTTPTHAVRVMAPRRDAYFRLLSGVLPPLADTVLGRRHFYRAVPCDQLAADRAAANWRCDDLSPRVSVAPSLFATAYHDAVRRAGGSMVRLELPSSGALSAANSLWRTDWAVNMIEQIIGLHYGCLLANRSADPVRFCWPAMLDTLRDSARLIAFGQQTTKPVRLDARSRVTVPPGHILAAAR